MVTNGKIGSPHSHNDNLKKDQTALKTILEGTVAYTGNEFFRALVKHLAEALHAKAAWITEYI
ncbi:MAG: hypothetical protein U5K69_03220 [Balneolaceae bacterium]|nr:hypothetical protein [Balneolaceae bacterium]